MITHMTKRLLVCAALAVAPMLATAPMLAATCEGLASLKSTPSTTITEAHTVAAGAFTVAPPGNVPAATRRVALDFRTMPAFCRVQGVIQPSNRLAH